MWETKTNRPQVGFFVGLNPPQFRITAGNPEQKQNESENEDFSGLRTGFGKSIVFSQVCLRITAGNPGQKQKESENEDLEQKQKEIENEGYYRFVHCTFG